MQRLLPITRSGGQSGFDQQQTVGCKSGYGHPTFEPDRTSGDDGNGFHDGLPCEFRPAFALRGAEKRNLKGTGYEASANSLGQDVVRATTASCPTPAAACLSKDRRLLKGQPRHD